MFGEDSKTVRFYLFYRDDGFATDVKNLEDAICGDIRGERDFGLLRRLISRLMLGTAEEEIDCIIALVESFHVDATYRDLYYSQYARRHFNTPRFTYRVSFFDDFSVYRGQTTGRYDGESFKQAYNLSTWVEASVELIQEAYLGSVVINPVAQSLVCKALLNPSRSMYWTTELSVDSNKRDLVADTAFMRLSEFAVNIAGKKLSVAAFPFHGQDGEVLSCAEVTLLNLTRYYSNEYSGYPIVEPSDILEAERQRAYSRIIPSTGLSYQTLCSILCDFGFRPELYDRQRIELDNIGNRTGESFTQQLIHIYLDSGIPVAVNVEPKNDPHDGHSLVLIGHGKPDSSLINVAYDNAILVGERALRNEEHKPTGSLESMNYTMRIIHSSDLYDSYVAIDDNQDPYSMRKFSELSIHPQMYTARFIAPIQRGMTVDAMDALTYFETIIRDPTDGVAGWASDWIVGATGVGKEDSESSYADVVMRVFLASTRRFKSFRVKTLDDYDRKARYASIPLPRFVWVCELYMLDSYQAFSNLSSQVGQLVEGDNLLSTRAFAEIVLDATVSRTTPARDAVLIKHFPDRIAYRMPDDLDDELTEYTELSDLEAFKGIPPYTENLTSVSSAHEPLR